MRDVSPSKFNDGTSIDIPLPTAQAGSSGSGSLTPGAIGKKGAKPAAENPAAQLKEKSIAAAADKAADTVKTPAKPARVQAAVDPCTAAAGQEDGYNETVLSYSDPVRRKAENRFLRCRGNDKYLDEYKKGSTRANCRRDVGLKEGYARAHHDKSSIFYEDCGGNGDATPYGEGFRTGWAKGAVARCPSYEEAYKAGVKAAGPIKLADSDNTGLVKWCRQWVPAYEEGYSAGLNGERAKRAEERQARTASRPSGTVELLNGLSEIGNGIQRGFQAQADREARETREYNAWKAAQDSGGSSSGGGGTFTRHLGGQSGRRSSGGSGGGSSSGGSNSTINSWVSPGAYERPGN